jgi:hypothetical protein
VIIDLQMFYQALFNGRFCRVIKPYFPNFEERYQSSPLRATAIQVKMFKFYFSSTIYFFLSAYDIGWRIRFSRVQGLGLIIPQNSKCILSGSVSRNCCGFAINSVLFPSPSIEVMNRAISNEKSSIFHNNKPLLLVGPLALANQACDDHNYGSLGLIEFAQFSNPSYKLDNDYINYITHVVIVPIELRPDTAYYENNPSFKAGNEFFITYSNNSIVTKDTHMTSANCMLCPFDHDDPLRSNVNKNKKRARCVLN